MAERKAVTKEMAIRYLKATKSIKGTLLDELCALTGWSRRHARRAIERAGSLEPRAPKRRREPIYGPEIIDALRRVWKIAGGPCGKRLAPFMEELVCALERHGEIDLDGQVRTKLLAMSASTIDRCLAAERKRLQVRGRHGTKPGTLLRHQIPIRTFAEWDDATPGFCEVDLVGHDGGMVLGEYAQTLNLTDVSSGWTEMRACLNKAQRHVFPAIQAIAARLPFPLRGLDSDNGSEFINDELYRWCSTKRITFTRTRPYRKNDNCFVEGKNWTHVRQQVGYARYEGEAAVAALNELYDVLRLWVNFFWPQQRLVSKTRTGARVHRRYDRAATPSHRLLNSPHITATAKKNLRRQFLGLNPAALSREIGRLQRRLVGFGVKPAGVVVAAATTKPSEPASATISVSRDPSNGRFTRVSASPSKFRAAKPRGQNLKEIKPGPDHPWRTSSMRQRIPASRTS